MDFYRDPGSRTLSIKLDESDYDELINGGQIVYHDREWDGHIRIILKDIGYARMAALLEKAILSRK